MMRLLLLCFCILLDVVRSTESSEDDNTIIDDDTCTLYLAPSSLPHNAGLGIYSAVARQPGDVLEATHDVCLPFVDLYWHHPAYFNGHLDDYLWNGRAMRTESRTGTVDAYCPGLNSLLNCHIGLINVLKSTPTYNDAGLHRAQHAGAGARTPYATAPATVARHIPAGGELFTFYGDAWFTARNATFGDHLPLSQDYRDAQELVQQLAALVHNTTTDDDLWTLLQELRQTMPSRTLQALPPSLQDCIMAADEGIASTLQPQHTRSTTWLHQHGRCVDHIEGRPSTLPETGQGAFARHDLRQGQIITTSPLIHLTQIHHRVLEMYNITKESKYFEDDEEDDDYDEDEEDYLYMRRVDELVNHQIASNYCFGHAETTLVVRAIYKRERQRLVCLCLCRLTLAHSVVFSTALSLWTGSQLPATPLPCKCRNSMGQGICRTQSQRCGIGIVGGLGCHAAHASL